MGSVLERRLDKAPVVNGEPFLGALGSGTQRIGAEQALTDALGVLRGGAYGPGLNSLLNPLRGDAGAEEALRRLQTTWRVPQHQRDCDKELQRCLRQADSVFQVCLAKCATLVATCIAVCTAICKFLGPIKCAACFLACGVLGTYCKLVCWLAHRTMDARCYEQHRLCLVTARPVPTPPLPY
jgi:hypothetical protein